ncbi:hypothetical protein ACHAWF_012591 [Thalassiosira exigua]
MQQSQSISARSEAAVVIHHRLRNEANNFGGLYRRQGRGAMEIDLLDLMGTYPLISLPYVDLTLQVSQHEAGLRGGIFLCLRRGHGLFVA